MHRKRSDTLDYYHQLTATFLQYIPVLSQYISMGFANEKYAMLKMEILPKKKQLKLYNFPIRKASEFSEKKKIPNTWN